jgi:hypothetical protein
MDAVALGGGEGFGLPDEAFGEALGMLGVVGETEALLIEVTLSATGVAEQPAAAAKAESVKAAQHGQDECTKAR